MNLPSYVNDYLTKFNQGLEKLDHAILSRVVTTLEEARANGRTVFVCGNGGSATTASHFAADLAKFASVNRQPSFKVIDLGGNRALLTAVANDESYDQVFARPLSSFVEREDVLVVFSASGRSKNVLEAVRLAREAGARTIGFVGFDGGRLRDAVDLALWFPEHHYGRVEDAHHLLCHVIANFFRDSVARS